MHDHSLDVHSTAEGQKKSKTGTWGVAPHLKQIIRAKVVDRKKPKNIMRQLRDEGITCKPSKTQLKNFVAICRNEALSVLKNENLASFFEWLKSNQYKDTLADDEMFALPGAILPEFIDLDSSDLRVVCVLSTRALLRNAIAQQDSSQATFVSMDGTFNLLANGWPTLAFGTVDWNHHFCTIGVSFTSHEDGDAFESSLKSLDEGIQLISPERKLKADFTMQDGARVFSMQLKISFSLNKSAVAGFM